jgi:hypothetical protein
MSVFPKVILKTQTKSLVASQDAVGFFSSKDTLFIVYRAFSTSITTFYLDRVKYLIPISNENNNGC